MNKFNAGQIEAEALKLAQACEWYNATMIDTAEEIEQIVAEERQKALKNGNKAALDFADLQEEIAYCLREHAEEWEKEHRQ